MQYNKTIFQNRIVDSWLIPGKWAGARYNVDLYDNGEYTCSCPAQRACSHIKKAQEWQANEGKREY